MKNHEKPRVIGHLPRLFYSFNYSVQNHFYRKNISKKFNIKMPRKIFLFLVRLWDGFLGHTTIFKSTIRYRQLNLAQSPDLVFEIWFSGFSKQLFLELWKYHSKRLSCLRTPHSILERKWVDWFPKHYWNFGKRKIDRKPNKTRNSEEQNLRKDLLMIQPNHRNVHFQNSKKKHRTRGRK